MLLVWTSWGGFGPFCVGLTVADVAPPVPATIGVIALAASDAVVSVDVKCINMENKCRLSTIRK